MGLVGRLHLNPAAESTVIRLSFSLPTAVLAICDLLWAATLITAHGNDATGTWPADGLHGALAYD